MFASDVLELVGVCHVVVEDYFFAFGRSRNDIGVSVCTHAARSTRGVVGHYVEVECRDRARAFFTQEDVGVICSLDAVGDLSHTHEVEQCGH